MKRPYQKPDICFDSFKLSDTIAGSCSYKTDTQTQDVCYVQFGDFKVFTSKVTGCIENGIIIESGEFNGLCYHVPTNNSTIFGS